MFTKQYANVAERATERVERRSRSRAASCSTGTTTSTYIQEPPFFTDLSPEPKPIQPIHGARVLVMVGDCVTTDHISPAGSIKKDSPAGKYLMEHGVDAARLQQLRRPPRQRPRDDRAAPSPTSACSNLLAPGTEGGVTTYLGMPDWRRGDDASTTPSMKYQADGIPLIVLAGKDYGMGSSRDWAAKGVYLLGVKAVIAESFERIHRSNLVGMGVLPLQYQEGPDPLQRSA